MENVRLLTKIEYAVELGITLSRSWFRGHSKVHDELTPSIFRKKYENEIYRFFRPEVEISVIESFKRQAPALKSNLPKNEDHISWLFLMQHYGAPTRLLDWTKSVLVGLYFAVNNYHSEDGELWALYPEALNEHNGYFGLPLPNCKILRYLATEPSHNKPQKTCGRTGIGWNPSVPTRGWSAASLPENGKSIKCLHYSPTSEAFPSNSRNNERRKKFGEIHHTSRVQKETSKKLALLGVTKASLFRDLDSLSHDITQEHNLVAYSPPLPPRWE